MKRALVGRGWRLAVGSVVLLACGHVGYDRTPDQPYDPSGQQPARVESRPAGAHRAADQGKDEERRTEEQQGSTAPRAIGGGPREPGGSTSTPSAVVSLATARCDREVKCQRIGPTEKYNNRSDCLADMDRPERLALSSEACPGGISEQGLASCLQSIRDERCDQRLEGLSRLPSCRSSNLCLR
jgi:hypothetical protein